jgi:hypothetical protein
MSFDTTQPIETIDTVQYNYSPTTFYKTQYQNTIKNSGYIKIPFTSKSNEPNIAIFGSGYTTTSLYIVQPTHLIENGHNSAELIIEHRSLTNYNEPLYTCFLLKSLLAQQPTKIDNLINGMDDTLLDLNALLKGQKTIVFKNNLLKSALVVIFTEPIIINTVFPTGSLKPGLDFLAPYVNTYSILKAEPILGNKSEYKTKDKIIEGVENPGDSGMFGDFEIPDIDGSSETQVVPSNDIPEGEYSGGPSVSIAGYCQPIDETDPTISQTAGIIVPMNSETSKNEAANSTIKTLLNFVGFFVLIIAAVFITPVAHRVLIVELILDNDEFSAQRKLNRSNAADTYTGAILFGFAIAFINYGIINNTPLSTILGFYCFIFLMASIMVLQYHRMTSPDTYLSQFKTKGVVPSFEDMEMDWGFFTDNISMLFFTSKMEPNPDPLTQAKEPMKKKYSFSFTFLIFGLIYMGIYQLLNRLKISGSGGKFFLTSIYFYIFLLTIYLVALVNHYRYVNNKLNFSPMSQIAKSLVNTVSGNKATDKE